MDFNPSISVDTLYGTTYVVKYDTNGNYKWGFNMNDAFASRIKVLNNDHVAINANVIHIGISDVDPGIGTYNLYGGVNFLDFKTLPFSIYLKPTYAIGLDKYTFEERRVLIYPNPTKGKLYVDLEEDIETVECYNQSGQKVKLVHFNNVIELGDIADGSYFLNVTTKATTYHCQFIKH